MNGKIYQQVEHAVLKSFALGSTVRLDDMLWHVACVGKPSARSGGEGKTDVYVLLDNDKSQTRELKISVKADSADWYENKMSQDRFGQIFTGEQRRAELAQQAIAKTTALAENGSVVLSGDDYIVVGYKLDIIGSHATGHTNSFEIELTHEEAEEVISGASLDAKKRHGFVNGRRIENSGAANYLVHTDRRFLDLSSAEQRMFVLENLISVSDHVSVPVNRKFRMKLSALSYGQRGSIRELSRKLFLTNQHAVENGKIISWVDADQDLFNRRARDVVARLDNSVRAKIER